MADTNNINAWRFFRKVSSFVVSELDATKTLRNNNVQLMTMSFALPSHKKMYMKWSATDAPAEYDNTGSIMFDSKVHNIEFKK